MHSVTVQVSDRVGVTAEGETSLEIFKGIASLSEVFDNPVCQKCKNKNEHGVSFVVRYVKDGQKTYEYPEIRCNDGKCRAKLTFGTGGDIFPIRHMRTKDGYTLDDEGKRIPKGTYGWIKYNHETGVEE